MRGRTLRRTALILCAAVILVISLSIAITVAHAEHHCADGRCSFCVAYQGAQGVMRILGFAANLLAAIFIGGSAGVRRAAQGRAALLSVSPVSLNIRLNN